MTAMASAARRWRSGSRAGWVESTVRWHGVIVGEQTGWRSGTWAGGLLYADCSERRLMADSGCRTRRLERSRSELSRRSCAERDGSQRSRWAVGTHVPATLRSFVEMRRVSSMSGTKGAADPRVAEAIRAARETACRWLGGVVATQGGSTSLSQSTAPVTATCRAIDADWRLAQRESS